jgi:hypothetical protein
LVNLNLSLPHIAESNICASSEASFQAGTAACCVGAVWQSTLTPSSRQMFERFLANVLPIRTGHFRCFALQPLQKQ